MAHGEEPDESRAHPGERGDGGCHSDRAGESSQYESTGRHWAPSGVPQAGHSVPERVRPGSLLVSGTDLTEPVFRRTVIYMIEHNDAGSLGVVVNRPSDTAVRHVLPQWSALAARPGVLYVGGPVKRDAAMCLATVRRGARVDHVPGLRRVDGRVALVDLDTDPAVVAPFLEAIRVFAGYAGWSFGQLDRELDREDWTVLSALPSDVMEPAGVDVWAKVLRRQPIPLALRASHPIEIERN